MKQYYNIKAYPDQNLVVEVCKGDWTVQVAKSYLKDFENVAKDVTGNGSWALLTDAVNWKSTDDEIIEIIGDHFEWNRKNGMTHNANVTSGIVEQRKLQQMFEAGGVSHIAKVFLSREEALEWLRKEGYSV